MLTAVSPQECLSLKTELSAVLLSNRMPEDEDSILVQTLGGTRIESLVERQQVPTGLHAVGASLRGEPFISLYFRSEEEADRFQEEQLLPPAMNDMLRIRVTAPALLAPPLDLDVNTGEPEDCSSKRRMRHRPVQGGISSGHLDISAGTLGAICRVSGFDGEVFALSNNHVFANVNLATKGDAIWQPGPLDNGASADKIGILHDFVPIRLGSRAVNVMDAALCRLANAGDAVFQVCSIGELGSPVEHEEGMAVKKHGRTTGLTHGFVEDESYDALVGMDHEDPSVIARFVNQILIRQADVAVPIGLGGDSGSLVVTENNEPVGLYIAGPEGGEYGIANPIGKVMEKLKILSFRA